MTSTRLSKTGDTSAKLLLRMKLLPRHSMSVPKVFCFMKMTSWTWKDAWKQALQWFWVGISLELKGFEGGPDRTGSETNLQRDSYLANAGLSYPEAPQCRLQHAHSGYL